MSTQNRKIGYYAIELINDEERSFDADLFKRLLKYINGLSGKDRIIKDKKSNKAVDIQEIEIYIKQEKEFAKVVFKSCKYNHSPNYMSSIDGKERETDKKLSEGEKELTHMLIRIDKNEAYTIFEERRVGTNIGNVIKFLNSSFYSLKEQEKLEDNRSLSYGYIPSDGFLKLIDDSERVVSAELFTERKILGSGYLEIMNLDDNSRDDIVISVKAKPRESLGKRAIKSAFNMIATEGSEVKRIRIYAKDDNNFNVIIDSQETKKIEEIIVDLKEDGTVDSYSIFSKMEDVLGVTE